MRGQRWLRILAGVLTVVVGLSLFAGCSFYKVKEVVELKKHTEPVVVRSRFVPLRISRQCQMVSIRL